MMRTLTVAVVVAVLVVVGVMFTGGTLEAACPVAATTYTNVTIQLVTETPLVIPGEVTLQYKSNGWLVFCDGEIEVLMLSPDGRSVVWL